MAEHTGLTPLSAPPPPTGRPRRWPGVAWSRIGLILVVMGLLAAVITPNVVDSGRSTTAAGVVAPEAVGSASAYASQSSGTATTAVPAGTTAGDVVVSIVETYPFATVVCPTTSKEVFDTVTGTTSLAACVTVVDGPLTTTSVTVQPATQVSMVTMAFSGVNAADPVQVAKAGSGTVTPWVDAKSADELLVVGEGSSAWQTVAGSPAGAVPGTTVNDAQDSQAAIATKVVVDGGIWRGRWSTVPARTAVSSVVALVPADATPVPASTTTTGPTTTTPGTVPGGPAPSTPPAQICNNPDELTGPATAPAGAVTLTPGEDIASEVADSHGPDTTFWFSPGTYTLGTGLYDQIIPQTGDIFIGGPGATIDGQDDNAYAFTQSATGVTIEYLTIEDFTAAGEGQGVVNSDSATGWVITHDTVEGTVEGAGVMLGSDDLLAYDCLTKNGEYGFSVYHVGGVTDVTVEDNEISYNDTHNWEVVDPGCGCSGGAKFWDTDGATVTDNYVHGNDSVGLWADTNNVGFTISDNYISDNYAEGIIYELSYNALISDNTLIGNADGIGPTNPGFPDGAIYISESGSDPRVPGPYGASFDITGNVLTNNWAGVVLWENSDRYCDSSANSSTGVCTLVDPSQVYMRTVTASWSTSEATTIDGDFPAGIDGDVLSNGAGGSFASSVPVGATVRSVTPGTSVTISAPVTGSGSGSGYYTSCSPTNLDGSAPGQTPVDYYDDCRWKTQNVSVTDNTFNFSPAAIGHDCTAANSCGLQGLFSEYGTYPPYLGEAVPEAISTTQNNHFDDNTYNGPWEFMVHDQSQVEPFSTWQSTWGQDAGSTFTP